MFGQCVERSAAGIGTVFKRAPVGVLMSNMPSYRVDVPGYSRPVLLQASPTSVIWRSVRLDGRCPVILKLLLQRDLGTSQAARREYSILRSVVSHNLISPVGVEQSSHGQILVMEDIGGESLETLLAAREDGRLDISDALEIGACVAEALDHLHLNGIIHGGIEPSNVIWNAETGEVRVLDLSSAIVLSEGRTSSDEQRVPMLPAQYLAPERIRRPVEERDTRSDLYSLGVLLYQLICGRVPFDGTDRAVRHAHLTLKPTPPRELVAELPEVLSAIILKLLEKRRQDRYQSAYGVTVDLRRVQQAHANGRAEPFALAGYDVPRGIAFSTRLFGRESELAKLREVYRRVRVGGSDVLIVSGTAGIGKSDLVNSVRELATEFPGAVLGGKFGQLEANVPHSALAAALRNFAHHLLAREQEVVDTWRDTLERELGSSVGVLIELAPEFEYVLGYRPAYAAHPLHESQNRFYMAMRQILRTVASLEGSAVLLLDDLQWADVGTLEVIQRLANDPAMHGVLILGTYRSDDMGNNRALSEFCARVQAKFGEAAFIRLTPLGEADIEALLRQSLGDISGGAAELAAITARKTGGNPLFARQFLIQMEREGLLEFDRSTGGWLAHLDAIDAFNVTENVVDLMVDVLKSFPESTRYVLSRAACVGSSFELAAVAAAVLRSTEHCARALEPALARGLISPAPGPESDAQESAEPSANGEGGVYRFVHDRIEQSAYAMLTESDRQDTHWRIGHWMMSARGEAELANVGFDTVDQLNRGYTPRRSPEQRRLLARINHEAGLRARKSAAYRASWRYLEEARRLATLRLWEEDPDRAAALWRDRAESAILLGRFKRAESVIREALVRLEEPVAQADFCTLRIIRHTLQNEYGAAIAEGRRILSELGETLPGEDIDAALASELNAADTVDLDDVLAHVTDRSLDDARVQAVMRILLNLQPPAFFTQPKLNWWIATRIFNLTVTAGYTPESAKGLANFANVLSIHSGFSRGHLVARQALELAKRDDTRHLSPRIRYTYLTDQHHWFHAFEDSQDLANEVYKECVESGELQYAGYVLGIHGCLNGFFFANDLGEFDKRLRSAFDFARSTLNQLAVEVIAATRLAVANLRGETASETEFETPLMGESAVRDSCLRSGNRLPIGLLDLLQGLCHFINGRYQNAGECTGLARRFGGHFSCSVAHLMVRACMFLIEMRSLALGAGTAQLSAEFSEDLELLEGRARDCPENFKPIWLLTRAEWARVAGDVPQAIEHYDDAIASARAAGRILYEALGNELAARFWMEAGRPHLAAHYVVEAERSYGSWGAARKAQALREEFGDQFFAGFEPSAEPGSFTVPGQPIHALDVENLLEASLDISNQLSVGGAVDVILERLLEVSGAERAALYLFEGALRLEATADATEQGIKITRSDPASGRWRPPASIVNYVSRLNTEVVVADVRHDDRFSDDPEVAHASVLSVACLPISQQGRLIAIMYLENDQSEGVFTSSRIKMLRVLSTQAAITLSRARMFNTLERRVEERTAELSALNRDLRSIVDDQVSQLEQDKMFRNFLAPPVADLVRSQGGRTLLKSHRREIAILFCDIRGFTAFCEAVEPEEAFRVLKNYHEAMGRLISRHEGTLVDRAGDGMMVIFNDPITCENPALKATRLALEMRETMHTLCREWKGLGYAMGFGMGIAQGQATIGLIGADEWFDSGEERWFETLSERLVRFDYSATGLDVNLASRLCAAAKHGQILVSERVSAAIDGVDGIDCEPLTAMRVKGFQSPVQVFSVEGRTDASSDLTARS